MSIQFLGTVVSMKELLHCVFSSSSEGKKRVELVSAHVFEFGLHHDFILLLNEMSLYKKWVL